VRLSRISSTNQTGHASSFEFAGRPQKAQVLMGNKTASKEKQTTAQGYAIPVPKRGDFFRNLEKAAAPEKSSKGRPKK
jgi:hypothetical protein